MIYLSSFRFSDVKRSNPNIYPYNVFRDKQTEPFVFAPITVMYGNNGSGKSTILNVIANKLQLKGREHANSNRYGIVDYCNKFSEECSYSLGDAENGQTLRDLPKESRYVKSEDILYEIKKIQQEQILSDGLVYDLIKKGKTRNAAEQYLGTVEGSNQLKYIMFAQEKYSNGETTLQFLDDILVPDALYLLDEPEVSLSPQNQVKLAENINKMVRFLGCQFIIATHSPFMLGTLDAKIYNIDTKYYEIQKWSELPNVRYFYDFFQKHRDSF